MSKKGLDWFLTERGKNFALLFSGTITTATVLGHILPNTVLLYKYRDTIRLYSNGFSVPVPKPIQDRFSKTLDLLDIVSYYRNDYKPFMVAGFDVFSIGTYSKFGVHIALPVNFAYEKVEDIDKAKIKVNLKSVNWENDAGKQLLNALVLPENAQVYAMAREIKMKSSNKFYLDTFYAGAACLCTYGFSSHLNRYLNLFSKPRPVRLFGYTLVLLFNVGNYFMAKDATQFYYEKKIDRELKEKSPIFADGGKEFYTRIIERNKALRTLMGKDGEKLYTILGNENYLIRQKHMPLVQRKEFFESKEKPDKPVDVNTEPLPS